MAENNRTKSPPKLPFITRLKLLILGLARHVYIRRNGTINRAVLRLIDIKASAPATKLIKGTRVSTSDVPIDPSRDLWFRLFVPTDRGSDRLLPLIVYFHGGGFTNFGPDSKSFDDLCSRLAAEAPAVVASVNYRLAPEQRYPCQYEDGLDALKFINVQNYAILPAATDLSKCFIAGDSAGGNIAHHVTFRACQDRHELDTVKIVGLVGLQPFFGGEERTESELRLTSLPMLNVERTDWMWRCFLPEGADRNHPAAHVFGDGPASKAAADLKNIEFPKVLVIKGGYDPLQDWQERYVQWLKNCGKTVEVIEYSNAFHGFYAFPELPGYDLLINDVTKFIQEQANCS